MLKKFTYRRNSKPLNLFSDGGWKDMTGSQKIGALTGVASAGVGVVGSVINNAQLQNLDSIQSEVDLEKNRKVSATDNESLMAEWNSYEPMSRVTWRDVKGGSAGETAMSILGGAASGASGGASFGGIGAGVGLLGGIFGSIAGRRKAKREAKRLNAEIDLANSTNLSNLLNRADTIEAQKELNLLSNIAAYGGNIHIKPSRKGTFTATAKKHNKSVQEFASQVLANPNNYSSAMVKKANFARNAAKWKHADGGPIKSLFDNNKDNTMIPLAPNTIDWYNIKKIHDRETDSKNMEYIDSKLKKVGFTNNQRIPILARIIEESGGNPKANNHDKGIGLIQWSPDRWDAKGKSLDEQINRIVEEIRDGNPNSTTWTHGGKGTGYKSYSDAYNSFFSKDSSLRDTSHAIVNGFVRPRDRNTDTKRNLDLSNLIYDNMYNRTKYSKGGSLNTNGSTFSNGLTFINNGDSHENNPNEGVLIGYDNEGIPNLVEEGEVIFDDYVFSNRLVANKNLLDKYKLPKSYHNHSFADIAERLSKESSERPNDPISNKGLNDSMTKLQLAQEEIRNNKMEDYNSTNKFERGGTMYKVPKVNIDRRTKDAYLESLKDTFLPTPNGISGRNAKTSLQEWASTLPKNKFQALRNIANNKLSSVDSTILRYAPVVGSLVGMFSGKPNYREAESIERFANSIPYTDYKPIGNFLQYNPMDKSFYTNKLESQAAGSRRALSELSGGNRGAAQASILASDYNYGRQLGDLARQAEEYNMNQRMQVENFNRGTNQANAQMALQAYNFNRDTDKLKSNLIGQAAQMRARERMIDEANRGSNISNLFDNLGNIGRENFINNMIESNPYLLYKTNRSGNINYKGSNGGFLTIKSRRHGKNKNN